MKKHTKERLDAFNKEMDGLVELGLVRRKSCERCNCAVYSLAEVPEEQLTNVCDKCQETMSVN